MNVLVSVLVDVLVVEGVVKVMETEVDVLELVDVGEVEDELDSLVGGVEDGVVIGGVEEGEVTGGVEDGVVVGVSEGVVDELLEEPGEEGLVEELREDEDMVDEEVENGL